MHRLGEPALRYVLDLLGNTCHRHYQPGSASGGQIVGLGVSRRLRKRLNTGTKGRESTRRGEG